MKEKLFSREENRMYCLELAGLYIRSFDYTTQTFLCLEGRYEETALFQIQKVKDNRMGEIQRRKSIITNG